MLNADTARLNSASSDEPQAHPPFRQKRDVMMRSPVSMAKLSLYFFTITAMRAKIHALSARPNSQAAQIPPLLCPVI